MDKGAFVPLLEIKMHFHVGFVTLEFFIKGLDTVTWLEKV